MHPFKLHVQYMYVAMHMVGSVANKFTRSTDVVKMQKLNTKFREIQENYQKLQQKSHNYIPHYSFSDCFQEKLKNS